MSWTGVGLFTILQRQPGRMGPPHEMGHGNDPTAHFTQRFDRHRRRQTYPTGVLGIIFFLARHGRRSQVNRFSLTPVDIDPENTADTGLSQDVMERFCLDTCGGKRRWLTVDACDSGTLHPAENFRELDSHDCGVVIVAARS